MPTPSPNPPPGPHSPRSYHTCPEDTGTRSSSRSSHIPAEAGEGSLHAAGGGSEETPVVPVIEVSSQTSHITESMIEDEPTSAISSRATTMSPAPESTVTSRTTPGLGTDFDVVKQMEVDEDEHQTTVEGLRLHDGESGASGTGRSSHPASNVQDAGPGKGSDVVHVMMGDEEELMAPSMGSDYPSLRTIPTSPSSFLRPGSKFHGTQQSERQVYDVQVEIKHVDLKESFLCGYLRIQGLTEDHPTLTTYFEGEIIGTKYNFFTNHDTWGATNKIDLNHWGKFAAFRPFQKQARKGPVSVRDVAQCENIFMRWKEHFLVPDHRVRTISGASFEGFYYICFNQVKGEVSGIYFHSKSEKFQQLELKHVEDKGCFGAMEFR
ncbi:hypothetical protein BN1723_007835 [Verticillium longisporum]|uniref:Vesicle-mediated transport protein Vid24 n=1 Tax=Verticillium longisporum TaxID=100787 RepID=A0A0G4LXP0_VERLO|nr:hypothetical protein BN1708_014488 [Verticillium longisporum]CRK47957.1 hypothetical protein BN1723_007835 [Verticillium longisporum]